MSEGAGLGHGHRCSFSHWWGIALLLTLVSFGCRGGSSTDSRTLQAQRFALDWNQPTRVADGDSIAGFSRVNWAGEMSDGTLVAGDVRLTELSFFPPSSPPFIGGRRGGGPGEFDYLLHGRVLASDSVLTSGELNLSIFTPTGQFQRSIPVPYPGLSHHIVGALGDSLFVLSVDISGIVPGFTTDSVRYVIVAASDGSIEHEFTTPFRWSYVYEPPDGRSFWTFPPFFGRAVVSVLGSRIVWGFGDDPYLRILDERGDRVDSIPVSIPERPISEDQFRRVRSDRLARADEEPQRLRNWQRMFDEVSFPDVHPFFDDLLVSSDGLLWLRVAEDPVPDIVQWWGQKVDGSLLRILSVPSRFQVVQLSDSTVVGIETDSLGVQRILVLPMVPETPPSR